MVNVFVALQPDGIMYEITLVPGVAPIVITPVDPTVATGALLLLHVPPLVASLSEKVDPPIQTSEDPSTGEIGFTVITVLTRQLPENE